MNPNAVITHPIALIVRGQPMPAYRHARREWMARVELALFASLGGYWGLLLLNVAGQV